MSVKPSCLFRLAPIVLAFAVPVWAGQLAHVPVRSDSLASAWTADGVVEAERHSEMAVQVAGMITEVKVHPGDRVKKGQLLVSVDARAASQLAVASRAQTEAARAQLDAAQKEYDRQKQLFAKGYISQAGLERAEAQFKAASAQAKASGASADAALTQSGFYTLTAPYDGIVADVPAQAGEMAAPGRVLVSLYDPAQMRVTAAVPQSKVDATIGTDAVRIAISGVKEAEAMVPARVVVYPAANQQTHTVQLRAWLGKAPATVVPGTFARVQIAGASTGGERLYIPQRAVLNRAEMRVVYVLDAKGNPLLRQVKLGPANGGEVEVLAGLSKGEHVALEPQQAARGK
ncbi:efflux RND transporter periplasmic adaptor subunit [Burkholderiaceae bacterium DAT-1]|nr:efflux RND transporter periplasmic adaptor subunit [Burkholderiaceae bacterium DAT-1]